MFRPCVFLFAVFCLIACSRHQALLAPQEVSTESGPAIRLSYVANPMTNGTRCMYDQPGLLYWSRLGLTATVLSRGQWVYHTYTWDYIGIEPSVGKVSYGINNGRITFPGDKLAIWTLE